MVRAHDDAGVAGLWCRRLELCDPLPHEAGEPWILRMEIALLERIGLEIVQLWPRCIDQFVAIAAERPEAAPAESFRIRRLGIGFELDVRPVRAHQSSKAYTVCRGDWHVQEVEQRWHQIDEPYRRRHPAGSEIRYTHDQRDTKRRLIQEDAVPVLAVFAEGFAVVRGDDDNRLVEQPP